MKHLLINCIIPLLLASCPNGPAYAQGYSERSEPLTRAEPVVRMVLQEANGQPFTGMIAVAGVAFDRTEDRRWPNTVPEVIYQGNHSARTAQFTGMSAKLNQYSDYQIARARQAVNLARLGHRPCGEVYWYHATRVSPYWMSSFDVACQIGDHIFYEDKS